MSTAKRRRATPASDAMPPSLAAFVALLDRCQAQVAHDPSGYTRNPHLYDALHHVYLRLCHGNITDCAVKEAK